MTASMSESTDLANFSCTRQESKPLELNTLINDEIGKQ